LRSRARSQWRSILTDKPDIRLALEAQRTAEQAFVERVRSNEKAPLGWPAALVLFHVGMWRERMRNVLASLSEGKDYERQPKNTDEFNEAELVRGIGTPLGDAAARAEHLLGELIELYEKVGERPIEWGISGNTTEAVLRNSYTHPRLHMYEYLMENGETDAARGLAEDAVSDMRTAHAPPLVLGAVLYNLAGVRAQQGKADAAIELLREAIPLRPDIRDFAPDDKDLGALREDPRFKELVKRP
jgi:tetratricopeptide (TPR) repeat protein